MVIYTHEEFMKKVEEKNKPEKKKEIKKGKKK